MVVDYQGNHLDCGNGEITRWVGSDCLEASVRLRLETVAHRKHLNIIMIVLIMVMMQMMIIMTTMVMPMADSKHGSILCTTYQQC